MLGKKTKVALSVGAAGFAAWAASKVTARPNPREGRNSLQFKEPIVIAQRGGSKSAPEHTMAAFKKAAEQGVNGFSVDVRLTKDEEIILFRSGSAEETTDFTGSVSNYTLSELQKADASYRFQETNDCSSFKAKDKSIVTLRELLDTFPHLFIIINMVDSPDTYEGSLIPSKLWGLLEEMGAEDRVAVGSLYDEQIDRFNLYAQHRIALCAGENEVRKAYTAFISKFGHLYSPRADVFVIPEKQSIFQMGNENFISFLSSLNVPVYFENVNNTESIEKLIKSGAAGFVEDQPDKALHVLQQFTGGQ